MEKKEEDICIHIIYITNCYIFSYILLRNIDQIMEFVLCLLQRDYQLMAIKQ